MRVASLLPLLSASPLIFAAPLSNTITSTPFPVVIWHGLGDSYNSIGLVSLGDDIVARYPGTYVHYIHVEDGGSADRRASFFGNANDQVQLVCDQLADIPDLEYGFDAIGLSQGGQMLRAYVERCNVPLVRNLVTVGSQHLGVSALPACHGPSDVLCNLVRRLAEGGAVYGDYAQRNIIPAQYFRDQHNIDKYLKYNAFLRDINNEQIGDNQPELDSLRSEPSAKGRNSSYKTKFESLTHFVMFKFSNDKTVIPATSAWFTLPNETASPPPPLQPIPLPLKSLPLYTQDYIGLRTLDEAGKVHYGECEGEHMQINRACWDDVLDWIGTGKRPSPASFGDKSRLVFQAPPFVL